MPSVPNSPLKELGSSYLAFKVLVGPIRLLQFSIALSETNSIPTTTSLVINDYNVGKNGFPLCSP